MANWKAEVKADLTKAEMLSRLKPRERAFSIDAVINPVPDEVGTASNVSPTR